MSYSLITCTLQVVRTDVILKKKKKKGMLYISTKLGG